MLRRLISKFFPRKKSVETEDDSYSHRPLSRIKFFVDLDNKRKS